MIAGKQKIGWGTGYLWNPINQIDPAKDVFLPDKYNIGVEGVNLDFSTDLLGEDNSTVIKIIVAGNELFSDFSEDSVVSGLNFYNLYKDNLDYGFVVFRGRNGFRTYGVYSSYDISGWVVSMELCRIKNGGRKYYQSVINVNKLVNEDLWFLIEFFGMVHDWGRD